jgi:hypothetical protein
VQHSGSRAGPSSYVQIYDPETGRFFTKPIRFSGHGKGPFEAAGVIDVQDPTTDIPNIVQEALQMRGMGPSATLQKQAQKQAIADELIAGGMKPKKAYAEAEQRIAGLLEPQAGVRGFNIVQPGDMVSGLTVRKDVPNKSSIAASFDDYEILSGIREVPRNAFDPEYLGSLSYDKLDQRTKDLAEQIRQSKEINPLIVGVDSKGAYIVEGGHRFDALMSQDFKSIPALVVIDKSDPPAAPMRAVSEIAEAAPITPKPPPPEPVRSDIGFYSQLEAATNPLQDKGTGDQFLSQLQKSAGVKPDEIKYTGLDEFLKGKKAVTKAEIQGYLASNKVDVQEVRLDRSLPVVQAERRGAFEAYDRGEITLEQRNAILEQSEAVNTKYHLGALKNIDTEIPGGENYRELLLTLPDTKGARLDARRAEIEAKGRNATDAEKQEWSSIMNQLQPETRDVEGLSPFRNRPEFRTTHFDQPNILAHMRVNDRTVDGKKTLFIEEVQSDWHQAGRKKGYAGADTKNAEAAFRQYSQELADKYNLNPEQNLSMYATMKGMQPEEVAKYDELQSAWVSSKGGVPDAPFKTTWHELTLKRAIQEASEKGYDQIAFTTGKTQAERYRLSKQVNSLKVERNTTGNYSLRIKRTDADKTFEPLKSNIPESELPDYIGKDLAQKIIEEGSGSRDFSKVYSGLDLQVGGEGMKGFYDQILPKSLEKLGKKFDAKVGKTEMDGVEVWQMDITPKMRESVTTKGQPLFSISGLGAGAIGSGFYQDDTMEQLSR